MTIEQEDAKKATCTTAPDRELEAADQRERNAKPSARHLKVAQFDGTHILSAEFADEVAKVKNNDWRSRRDQYSGPPSYWRAGLSSEIGA
jgi:hypothetical protein